MPWNPLASLVDDFQVRSVLVSLERSIINRHPTLQGVGDLPDSFDWRGRVLAVTVTNNG